MKKSAVVLGAGIQGCCVGLELLKAGWKVELIDQAEQPITRASLNQEGKLHLGFVYGLDRTGETGRRLVRHGLEFAPGLERLLERRVDWTKLTATPFNYLVDKDSLLTVEETEGFFRELEREWREALEGEAGLHYPGAEGRWFFERTAVPPEMAAGQFQAAYRTVETAVDQQGVRAMLVEALESHADCKLTMGEVVVGGRVHGGGVVVRTRRGDGEERERGAELAVNCLWEDRDRLDREVGLLGEGEEPPNLRLKFGVMTERDPALAGLASFTIVHGAFGDFVNTPQGHYFCWYPVSMKGMTRAWAVPAGWRKAVENRFEEGLKEALIEANEAKFRELMPGMGRMKVTGLKAGVIVAKGERDIDHRYTRLHFRKEAPLRREGGWWSVGTGKYTSGPINARLLGEALVEAGL